MGVVDYNPASKRFLVKRVLVPDKLLEKKKDKEEVTVQGSGVEEAAEAPTEERGSSPKESEAVSLHVCLCVFTMMFHCVVLHDLSPTPCCPESHGALSICCSLALTYTLMDQTGTPHHQWEGLILKGVEVDQVRTYVCMYAC